MHSFWKIFLAYLQVAVVTEILIPKPSDPDPHKFTPSRRWLVPLIADLIRNGTHDDHRAIPIAESHTVLSIISYVLGIEAGTAEGSDSDAMTEALNTTKGHWTGALVDFSLYICRDAERARKNHSVEWQFIKPVFERELEACKGANYEFSTLCGNYLANIYFLSPEWVRQRIEDIFPMDARYSRNFDCALQGFAYMDRGCF